MCYHWMLMLSQCGSWHGEKVRSQSAVSWSPGHDGSSANQRRVFWAADQSQPGTAAATSDPGRGIDPSPDQYPETESGQYQATDWVANSAVVLNCLYNAQCDQQYTIPTILSLSLSLNSNFFKSFVSEICSIEWYVDLINMQIAQSLW